MTNIHYVYAHFTSANEPFYIGKGSGKRWRSPNGRSVEWAEVAGSDWTARKITSAVPECCAFCLERVFIHVVGREALINKSDGGAGGSSGSKRTWLQRLTASCSAKMARRDAVKSRRISDAIRKPEKFRITHPVHGEHLATRYEMKSLYGFSSSAATSLVKGTYKSWHKWKIIR